VHYGLLHLLSLLSCLHSIVPLLLWAVNAPFWEGTSSERISLRGNASDASPVIAGRGAPSPVSVDPF